MSGVWLYRCNYAGMSGICWLPVSHFSAHPRGGGGPVAPQSAHPRGGGGPAVPLSARPRESGDPGPVRDATIKFSSSGRQQDAVPAVLVQPHAATSFDDGLELVKIRRLDEISRGTEQFCHFLVVRIIGRRADDDHRIHQHLLLLHLD